MTLGRGAVATQPRAGDFRMMGTRCIHPAPGGRREPG